VTKRRRYTCLIGKVIESGKNGVALRALGILVAGAACVPSATVAKNDGGAAGSAGTAGGSTDAGGPGGAGGSATDAARDLIDGADADAGENIDGRDGADGGSVWRCEGKTDLIEAQQLQWQTNPGTSGIYQSQLYAFDTTIGPSNPSADYPDQIATGNLSNLPAGSLWACVDYEIVSGPTSSSVEIHVGSAPPDVYSTVLTAPASRAVGRYSDCAPGAASRVFTGWQFLFEVWTPGVTYKLHRAAVCQQ
jgi:hypothetical protein